MHLCIFEFLHLDSLVLESFSMRITNATDKSTIFFWQINIYISWQIQMHIMTNSGLRLSTYLFRIPTSVAKKNRKKTTWFYSANNTSKLSFPYDDVLFLKSSIVMNCKIQLFLSWWWSKHHNLENSPFITKGRL